MALASKKPAHRDPPVLGFGIPQQWFQEAVRMVEAKLAPIRQKIALEAAAVAVATGHGDSGDCFLIATALVRRLSIVTRDSKIIELAGRGYIAAVEC